MGFRLTHLFVQNQDYNHHSNNSNTSHITRATINCHAQFTLGTFGETCQSDAHLALALATH